MDQFIQSIKREIAEHFNTSKDNVTCERMYDELGTEKNVMIVRECFPNGRVARITVELIGDGKNIILSPPIDITKLEPGFEFDLSTNRGHFYRLQYFAKPASRNEDWDFRESGIDYIKCDRSEATHVCGWNEWTAFLTIDRLISEGHPRR